MPILLNWSPNLFSSFRKILCRSSTWLSVLRGLVDGMAVKALIHLSDTLKMGDSTWSWRLLFKLWT